jgi:hypothetical protein
MSSEEINWIEMAQDNNTIVNFYGVSTALSETIPQVNLLIRWKTNSDPLAAKTVASRYTDCTIPAYTSTIRNVYVVSSQ